MLHISNMYWQGKRSCFDPKRYVLIQTSPYVNITDTRHAHPNCFLLYQHQRASIYSCHWLYHLDLSGWYHVIHLFVNQCGGDSVDQNFNGIFLNKKSEFMWNDKYYKGFYLCLASIGLDNGLVPIWHQTIIWSNDCTVFEAYIRHFAKKSICFSVA